jgi:hypothetical protein
MEYRSISIKLSIPVRFLDHQLTSEWQPQICTQQKVGKATAESAAIRLGKDRLVLVSWRLRDVDQSIEFRCSALVEYCGDVAEHHVAARGHLLGHFKSRVLIPCQLLL